MPQTEPYIRDCTIEEKDALLVFLIGFFLSYNSQGPAMFVTPELVEGSFFSGRLPSYDTKENVYHLRRF